VLFDKAGLRVDSYFEELSSSLGEALLRPHRNYAPAVLPLLEKFDILGIAHLTGGGFYDNIPRVLPVGTAVEIYKNSWPVLPIFSMIQKLGSISFEEMHHVFNMGIGLVLVVKEEQADGIRAALSESGQDPYLIGRVIEGQREVSFSLG
jgi:phosphoribosylformylglycinamidine cyclo-ligase